MNGNEDEGPSSRKNYSAEEHEAVLAALKKYNIGDAKILISLAERLVFGMSTWIYFDDVTSWKSQKQYLSKLNNQARKTQLTLEQIDYSTAELLATCIGKTFENDGADSAEEDSSTTELLSGICVAVAMLSRASELAIEFDEDPKLKEKHRGRPRKNGALVALISMLRDEWCERDLDVGFNVNKETGALSGPFCSFLDAALRPVLSSQISQTRFKHCIREALRDDYDRPGSYLIEVPDKKFFISARRTGDKT